MNYNDYDSNGNEKNFNFTDIMTDKKQRARVILLFYVIVFLILIIMIRVGTTSSNKEVVEKDKNEKVEEIEKEESKENTEIDEKFSFIDQNNYNFTFNIEYKYNDITSLQTIEGKRFNNKYDFTLQYSDLTSSSIIEFIGTNNYIKARENENSEYELADFPYVYLNFFDNNLLKIILENSTLNQDVYEISNEKLSELINEGSSNILDNKDDINTLKLTIKNNKIVGMNIDFSNVLSDYRKEQINAVIELEYLNFGLIDDFEINF